MRSDLPCRIYQNGSLLRRRLNRIQQGVGMEHDMTFEPKSIAEQIDSLARLTGASDTFIGQVRALFEKKGIGLDSDAAPYLSALEEAFRREENIRASTRQARESVTRMQGNFTQMGKSYVEKAKNWTATRGKAPATAPRPRRQPIAIQGDHRSYITQPQREDFPLVPGPKETQ